MDAINCFPVINVGKLNEVNSNCLGIATELASINQYISPDKVLYVLLQRYSIMHFEQLNIGSFYSLQSVALIWELNKKVTSYVEQYIAVRSIITLTSLEIDLVRFLNSLNMPSLLSLCKPIQPPIQSLHHQQVMQTDPNEISLDIDNIDNHDNELVEKNDRPSSQSVALSFLQYGLGPLCNHPIIMQYFPLNSSTSSVTKTGLTTKDLHQHLIAYLSQYHGYQFQNTFTVSQFTQYLCRIYKVSDLRTIGVLLQGDLIEDVLTFKHIIHAKQQLIVDVTNTELHNVATERKNCGVTSITAANNLDSNTGNDVNNNNNKTNNNKNDYDLCMQPPTEFNPQSISTFIADIQSQLSTVYSPTYGKLRTIVEAYITKKFSRLLDARENISGNNSFESAQTASVGADIANKKRKKQKHISGYTKVEQQDEELWQYYHNNTNTSNRGKKANKSAQLSSSAISPILSQIIDVMTEYAMLHLGGKRYLHKRVLRGSSVDECNGNIDREEDVDVQLKGGDIISGDDVHNKSDSEKESDHNSRDGNDSDDGSDDSQRAVEDKNTKNELTIEDKVAIDLVSQPECATAASTLPDGSCSTSAVTMRPRFDSNNNNNNHDRFECRVHSTLPQLALHLYPDNLNCNLAVITTEQLKGLMPNMHTLIGPLDPKDTKAVGRWGEMLVYQYLLMTYVVISSNDENDKLNRHHNSTTSSTSHKLGISSAVNINWLNEHAESNASYDLILENNHVHGRQRTSYIEVKTTRYAELNCFELSLWEWEFATKEPRVPYHIYRVFNAGDANKVKIVVIKDILACLHERKVKLCLAI